MKLGQPRVLPTLGPPSLSSVVAIYGGTEHTAAVLADGSIVCWGQNSCGECDVPVDCNVMMCGTILLLANVLRFSSILWFTNGY
jgi:alpha-tubulin suppressor-like RCC1 family protein